MQREHIIHDIPQPNKKLEKENSIKPKDNQEQKQFSAEKHQKQICSVILEMTNSDQVKSFFEQFHADDIKEFKLLINREMISGSPSSSVADLIHHTTLKKPIDTKGINTHAPEDLRLQFIKFCQEFMSIVNNEIPARIVLGIDENTPLDLDLIENRTKELYKILYVHGKKQPQNFFRKLIEKANLKLRQELTKKKEEESLPEPWLDLKKEQTYTSLINSLEKMSHTEQITWLGLILNTEFTEEDAQNIKILFVDSPDASKITNRQIRRPIIECSDAKTLVLLAQKTNHSQPEKVGGFVLTGEKLKKNGLEGIGLIVTTNNPETTKHEIRHSIEPKERFGTDRALSEIFAYAERYIKTNEWQKLEEMVLNEVYFDTYKTGTNDIDPRIREQFTEDEKKLFENQVHSAIMHLKKQVANNGELPALRELLTIGSLQEYYDEDLKKRKDQMAKMKIG